MSVVETLSSRGPAMAGAWRATIATEADDILMPVMVTIPAFDANLQWGPCRWMPRGNSVTFPVRGDQALVIFDNERTPWIISWWPF